MPYLGEAGRATSPGASNQASLDVPLLIDAPVGTTLMLAVQAPAASAITNYAATDPGGNTWTQQEFIAGATLSNVQLGVLTCKVTSALTTGQNVNVTAPPRSPSFWGVLIQAFDDLDTVDVHTHNTATGTAMATGTTAAASQNAQLLFGAWAWAGSTDFTATPAGWTVPAILTTPSTAKSLRVGWEYVDAAGTRAATATHSQSLMYGAAIVAMNQQAAAAPTYGRYIKNDAGVFVSSTTKRLVGGVWT